MRLIDGDALYETLCHIWDRTDSEDFEKAVFETIINAPAIEPERKKGKWITKDLDNFRKYEVVCSECGSRYIGNYDAYDEPYDFNYCPNCGSYNGGGQDEVS